MQKREPKRVLALVADLLFTVKIADAAKRAGMQAEFVKSEKALFEKVDPHLALIILDLNFAGVQPLKLIGKLRDKAELKKVSLLAYVSHVDGELKQKAHDLGCHMVMARSAFSQNLPMILRRHAGTP
ncbi:MAG: response regulator [Bryobacterales bacterium]|nr:response regulator [Bryobacterales bacterium]